MAAGSCRSEHERPPLDGSELDDDEQVEHGHEHKRSEHRNHVAEPETESIHSFILLNFIYLCQDGQWINTRIKLQ